MIAELLMVAGVGVLAMPALALGIRGLTRRSGHYSADSGTDRASLILLVAIRLLVLLLLLALSAITLVAAVGAMIRSVEMPSLVWVFFLLDVLIAVLVLVTFGRPDRRRAHRRATPAAR